MPYATNPLDGVRTYFEDAGGDGIPVLVYTGLGDPLEDARANPLVQALTPHHRLVLADHRGHGRSDKPHEVAAYALPLRVADAVAVLDELDSQRAHYLGFSWGARLGFAVGEHAPERLASLVLCGNQPYEWDPAWPFVPMLTRAFGLARVEGMQAFLDALEQTFGDRIEEPNRGWILDADPLALAAAWESALKEGRICDDLTRWTIPCLIYVAQGEEMEPNARRAADEIPGARFISLPGHTHLSAVYEVDRLLEPIRQQLAGS